MLEVVELSIFRRTSTCTVFAMFPVAMSLFVKDTGLCVALGVEHDLGSTVPPRGHVFRQESGVVVVGISHSRQTKITDLKVINTNKWRLQFKQG